MSKIGVYLQRSGLSLNEAARLTGIDRRTIKRWADGSLEPPAALEGALSRFFAHELPIARKFETLPTPLYIKRSSRRGRVVNTKKRTQNLLKDGRRMVANLSDS